MAILLLVAGCTCKGELNGPQPQPDPQPEPKPTPDEEVVETTFALTLRHSMSRLHSPEWHGAAPQGTVDWGDGAKEEYREDMTHNYTSEGQYDAKFEMAEVDGFEIKQLGDIERINIAL